MRRSLLGSLAVASGALLVATALPGVVQASQAGTAGPSAAAQSEFPATSVSGGGQTSCETRADGTAWCWGRNHFGQIGDGTLGARSAPTQVIGTGWASISTSGSATCGVKLDTTLWCWGLNNYGQLGTGGTKMEKKPKQVEGTGWKQVAVSWFHACGVRTDGRMHCWGQNSRGQLGIGRVDAKPRRTPVRVGTDSDWASVTAGGYHTCGIRTDGTAWCFGDNPFGQSGQQGEGFRPSPVQVGVDQNWSQLSTSWGHTCGVRVSGELSCFGLNNTGQLGNGNTTNRWTPTRVAGDASYQAVATADASTCALDDAGQVWCWGDNTYGQVGAGGGARTTMPVLRSTGEGYTLIGAGWSHSCASGPTVVTTCWGANELGELGVPPARAQARRQALAGRAGSGYLPRSVAADLERRTPGQIARLGVGSRPPVTAKRKGPMDFRYSTFNILGSQHTSPTGSRRDWAPGRLRTDWANTLIRRMNVSLVGFQEIQPDQVIAFDQATHGSWRVYPGNGSEGYVGATQSVAWDRAVWKPVWKTTVAMPFMDGWRPQPVVRLRNRATGHDAYLINVHYSPGKMESDRDKATKITIRTVRTLSKDGLPVLLTGDFNERTEAYCAILKKTKLKAAMGGRYVRGTCKPPAAARVDWIFGSLGKFSEFSVIQDAEVRRLTDHSVHATRMTVG